MIKPYYQDSAVTLYHGDCKEIVPQLGKFDLLLTDPPYGLGISSNPVRQAHASMAWDNSPVDSNLLELVVGKATNSIVWGGNYFKLPPQKGFLVWDKVQPEDFSLAMCEQAWTNINTPAKIFKMRVVGYAKKHPTQKPVDLMAWCISIADKKFSAQKILDPFAGSGTTGRAAKDLGRKCTLIEREEKYCEIIVKRMQQEVLDLN